MPDIGLYRSAGFHIFGRLAEYFLKVNDTECFTTQWGWGIQSPVKL